MQVFEIICGHIAWARGMVIFLGRRPDLCVFVRFFESRVRKHRASLLSVVCFCSALSILLCCCSVALSLRPGHYARRGSCRGSNIWSLCGSDHLIYVFPWQEGTPSSPFWSRKTQQCQHFFNMNFEGAHQEFCS